MEGNHARCFSVTRESSEPVEDLSKNETTDSIPNDLVHLHSCKKMYNNKYIVDSVDCYNSQIIIRTVIYNHKGETMYYRIVTNHVKTGTWK